MKKRFHPLTKLVVVLFFFGFERLTWKGHGFLHPWFSFLPMSSCNEVITSVLLALVRCFFFSNLKWIILFTIFFRFNTVFSFSIGGRYVVWMNNKSSSTIGSLELSASLCFFFFFFFFGELTISSSCT